MVMNISANLLGLDNAATPLGLKAMQELQTLNPRPSAPPTRRSCSWCSTRRASR
jgi:spore maturation protein SpmA